jgi:hypothetical protein
MKHTTPKVLYSVPEPQTDFSELYKINAEILDTATDPVKRWVVIEEHGYWDEASKKFLIRRTTLHPNDPKHCLSLEDVQRTVDDQIMVRVKSGFKYLFETSLEEVPPKKIRREVFPDRTSKIY